MIKKHFRSDLLDQLMTEKGLNAQSLSDEIHRHEKYCLAKISARNIQRWKNQQVIPSKGFVKRLADYFGLHQYDFYTAVPSTINCKEEWNTAEAEAIKTFLDKPSLITPEWISRTVHEWLVTPTPQWLELRAGNNIGSSLVTQVETRVVVLRHMDDFIGGRDLLTLVAQEMQQTLQLVNKGVFKEKLGKRLLIAIGELCQLAGWVASDAGAHNTANQYFALGIKVAHAAGDRSLAANNISTLAYHTTNTGNENDGLLLARSAFMGAQKTASNTTQALLLERIAWAHACLGQVQSAEKVLAAVERAYDKSNREYDPEWTYWLNEDEINVMAARCFIKAQRPQQAIEKFEGILDAYDPQHTREIALYASWLSEAHIMAKNIEDAAYFASMALNLSAKTTSNRSDERLKVLYSQLKPLGNHTAVRHFTENLREYFNALKSSTTHNGIHK